MKYLIVLLPLMAITPGSLANNIQVTNVSLTGQNTTNKTVQVQFTVSWQNSWRVSAGPANWDAAWVFVKYRKGNGPWLHAHLNANINHVAPSGSTITTGLLTTMSPHHTTLNPGIGAFIYRSANGSGTFTVTNAQLQWKYNVNGLLDNDVVDVQVFAIEMVYVPQGAFAVGDGFVDVSQHPLTTINTANATTPPSGVGSLGGQAGGHPPGILSPPNFPAWPNGFSAFYCMKYEISQQGYVDFLNTLDRAQQTNRVETDITSGITSITNRFVMLSRTSVDYRNGIRCDATIPASGPVFFYCDFDGDGTGGESSDGKDIACNDITWADVAAYLHWAGLRPLTELEFEKCGRGANQLPVIGEYAWGNTLISGITSIANPGLSYEEPNVGANAMYNNVIYGPIRVGSIADAATSRQQAGAGYYGAMEFSGNLIERVVTLSSTNGRAYIGNHGFGILDASGNATNSDWPPSSASGIYDRGGSWGHLQIGLRLSNRQQSTGPNRNPWSGGRGCRTAP